VVFKFKYEPVNRILAVPPVTFTLGEVVAVHAPTCISRTPVVVVEIELITRDPVIVKLVLVDVAQIIPVPVKLTTPVPNCNDLTLLLLDPNEPQRRLKLFKLIVPAVRAIVPVSEIDKLSSSCHEPPPVPLNVMPGSTMPSVLIVLAAVEVNVQLPKADHVTPVPVISRFPATANTPVSMNVRVPAVALAIVKLRHDKV
jgi:hypothetical protein